MEILIGIAAIGVILFTLPLILGLLGMVLSFGLWLGGAAVVIAVAVFNKICC